MNLKYVLKNPIITEKSLREAAEKNTYTFQVDRRANKHHIKEAVEKEFEVGVSDVRTAKIRGEVKARGGMRMRPRRTPDIKKAYVKLVEGDKIEEFEVGG